jgi:hypothetical protein
MTSDVDAESNRGNAILEEGALLLLGLNEDIKAGASRIVQVILENVRLSIESDNKPNTC